MSEVNQKYTPPASPQQQKLGRAPVAVELDLQDGVPEEISADLSKFKDIRRASNYLAAAMIYLQDNFLLRRRLKVEDIKERLLGHWGTCPGINLVYAHFSYLIKKRDIRGLLVSGPGHGAPAILANLFLEGSIQKFYSEYTNDSNGLKELIRKFSWPPTLPSANAQMGGFPSHTNSLVPGTIHEGGELGYALSASFGAVMDNPDLIVTCIVGDGEAETGPTATAWHSYKFIDPKESGGVIPILHLNRFKISETTIFGCMSDEELLSLFTGYGYRVRFVGDGLGKDAAYDIDADMQVSLTWAYDEILRIQTAARTNNPIFRPQWPMIILKTPKGWTCPKKLPNGDQLEGTYRSHQVPLKNVRTDLNELRLLEEWLSSYNVNDFFAEDGTFDADLREAIFPRDVRKLGQVKDAYPDWQPLEMPDLLQNYNGLERSTFQSPTKFAGRLLKDVMKLNPKRFRIFCPDEMESNKLTEVFDVTTRNFQWDMATANKGGRVIEVLSEHQCQGWAQGYTLTGRYALFPSYEAFLGIITTMMIQYAKFAQVAEQTSWRPPLPCMTYLETSTLWRQEHNGFSHQNPAFINNLINMKSKNIRIYLPPDANTMVSTLHHCLSAKKYINLIISSKQSNPVYFTMNEAVEHCRAGAGILKWASTDGGANPDVVLVGCGTEVTFEVLAAAALLKKEASKLRVRVVNVTDLMVISAHGGHSHALQQDAFESLFTANKPVIFSFHGYPSVIRQLLFDRPKINERISIHGYLEEGTTTTPFMMLTSNQSSRFDIAIAALRLAGTKHPLVSLDSHTLITRYQAKLKDCAVYAGQFGKDPEWVTEMPTF